MQGSVLKTPKIPLLDENRPPCRMVSWWSFSFVPPEIISYFLNMSNVLILRAPGTNCDLETAYAFEKAGAKSERLHINRVLEKPSVLEKFQILCFAGGFSFGDDIAAGKILANLLKHHLSEPMQKFRDAGKLILGICNGFQVLIKSGFLLEEEAGNPPATLTWNLSGTYTDRWVDLEIDAKSREKCVFLKNVQSLYLPVAHAEGRFVPKDESTLQELQNAGQLSLKYSERTNPNGSTAHVAGICDATGRVFGLMPHPERHLDPYQHPHWTRIAPKDRPQYGDGFALFKNAVDFFK